jgi:hypothetical protein
MKKIVVIFTFSFICNSILSQAPNWSWANFGNNVGHDYGTSISADANGNTYMTGYSQAPSITFGNYTLTDPAPYNFFLVKHDSVGNVVWAKASANAVYAYGTCVSTDNNGNSYVTGYCTNGGPITFGSITLNTTNSPGGTAFIVKYDANGTVLWAKVLGALGQIFSLEPKVNNAIDANGNVYVVFQNDTSSTFNYFTKLNSAGNIVWQKTINGDYNSPNICTDSVGNCFVTGIFNGNATSLTFNLTTITGTGLDLFVVKYDSAGNVIWAKNDGNGGCAASMPSIATDGNGNCYIAGTLYNSFATFGTVIMSNISGCSCADIFFLKYDSTGNLVWAKQAGQLNHDETVHGLKVDKNGNAYLTGLFQYAATFGNVNLNSVYNVDVYVVKYDSYGNAIWAQKAIGSGADVGQGITLDATGNIYVAGNFFSDVFQLGTIALTNSDTISFASEAFVAKLANNVISNPVEVNPQIFAQNKIMLYPNPCIISTCIFSEKYLQQATVIIRNCFGQTVKQIKNISGNKFVLNRGDLLAGNYFIDVIQNGATISTSKCIIVDE